MYALFNSQHQPFYDQFEMTIVEFNFINFIAIIK